MIRLKLIKRYKNIGVNYQAKTNVHTSVIGSDLTMYSSSSTFENIEIVNNVSASPHMLIIKNCIEQETYVENPGKLLR